MGPSGRLYSYWIVLDCLGQVCIWVELPVQRRLCPIFVRDVGSPDIHECFHGLTGSQRTPGFWGFTWQTFRVQCILSGRYTDIH